MPNFFGGLQPVKPKFEHMSYKPGVSREMVECPRVCGKGQCTDEADAREQLAKLYKETYPEYSKWVDDKKSCFGGIFIFECTPYEVIEKAADANSAALIQRIYEESVELAPLSV